MKAVCALYVEYDSPKDLEQMPWDEFPKPLLSIGSGSNILFTGDFPGTVLHSAIKYTKYVDLGMDDLPIAVGAGVTVDDFIAEVCGHGLWGMENLSLIPGEIGASVVQNIGAYGAEMKDVVTGVSCYDVVERRMVKFPTPQCGFAYRDSLFKQSDGRYIVTGVLVRLSRKPRPNLSYKGLAESFGGVMPETPTQVREAVIALRNGKLPDPKEIGSAGSFFKNPVVTAAHFAKICEGYATVPHFVLEGGMIKVPAAWMIEQCGFKGAVQGGAAVYEKQPLVIVNASGTASAQDVLTLENRIISAVRERFGVELHPEVVHI
ncbi:MAG: UDP-N-acetylmuramate dehydrogenase [Bacteroidales bacterium]|nr:UDP-N-acetylmuramate dehydrogenase [Bacteroidales bacterium]